MPWMETRAGHVELLVGLDHKQWLPVHVEDSWNPDDDMRLMKSVFGHRYMITDGWGRDLNKARPLCDLIKLNTILAQEYVAGKASTGTHVTSHLLNTGRFYMALYPPY